MHFPKVEIIVTTYNNADIISECLDSIKGLDYPTFDCTVIDDASTDNIMNIIKQKYPWVQIISKSERKGPAHSRNLGVKDTQGEYIAFLDSDIVLHKNWLKKIIKKMERNPDIGIVAGKNLLPDGKIDSAGGGLYKIGSGYDIKKDGPSRKVMYACSAAMVVRSFMLKGMAKFDETYFYGHEDTDLGWRCNLLGFKVIYEPNAIAYHKKNITIKKMPNAVYFHGTKNRIRSLIKNYQFYNLVMYLPLYFLYSLWGICFGSHKKAKIKAWIWNIKQLGDTVRERKRVQSTRIVKDKDLPWNEKF